MIKKANFLIGEPGAGKSFFCKLAKKDFDIEWISMSKLLLNDYSSTKKELVNDETVIHILSNYIRSTAVNEIMNIDGYPRTEVQAKAILKWNQSKLIEPKVLVLTYESLDPNIIWEYLKRRKTCNSCGFTVIQCDGFLLKQSCPNCSHGKLTSRFMDKSEYLYRVQDYRYYIKKILLTFEEENIPTKTLHVNPCNPNVIQYLIKEKENEFF